MIKSKYRAFTLSETLITLAIVGIIAILVIPGFIKGASDKSRMTLLHNTVSNINNVVQNEMVRSGASSLSQTRIYTSPETFLKTFDYTSIGDAFPAKYQSINQSAYTTPATTNAKLKNGSSIGIAKISGSTSVLITLDINGKDEPNKIGIDYFELEITGVTDYDTGKHAGDVGAFQDNATVAGCKGGNPKMCYRLAELSGFDPDYLSKDYSTEE